MLAAKAFGLLLVLLFAPCMAVFAGPDTSPGQEAVEVVNGAGQEGLESKSESSPPTGSYRVGKGPDYEMAGGSLMNTALGLVVVLALIVGLAWLLRRFGGLPTVGKGAVSIVGGVSLGPRERAVLLQVGETQVLVGVAPGQVNALHVFDKEQSKASGEEEIEQFSQRLKEELKGGAS